MIYIMSQKFLGKNIEKMAKRANYFIVDGENYGATGRVSSSEQAIATRFSNAKGIGGFCPEARVCEVLRKLYRGDNVNQNRVRRFTDDFLEDERFITAVVTALFAFIIGNKSNKHTNLFIVLPDFLYKTIGGEIIKRVEIISGIPKIISNQKALKTDLSILDRSTAIKDIDKLEARCKKLEKKYESFYDEDVISQHASRKPDEMSPKDLVNVGFSNWVMVDYE